MGKKCTDSRVRSKSYDVTLLSLLHGRWPPSSPLPPACLQTNSYSCLGHWAKIEKTSPNIVCKLQSQSGYVPAPITHSTGITYTHLKQDFFLCVLFYLFYIFSTEHVLVLWTAKGLFLIFSAKPSSTPAASKSIHLPHSVSFLCLGWNQPCISSYFFR